MEDKKSLIKDGRDFQAYPAMRVAKIYEPYLNQVHSHTIQGPNTEANYKRFVEIALPEFNQSIEKTTSIHKDVDRILDIDWKVEVNSHHIHFPTAHLMISGKMAGDIQYTTKRGKTYIKRLFIPWRISTTVTYTYPPFIKKENVKEENQFKGTDGDLLQHRVQYIYGGEVLTKCELLAAKITTADEIARKNGEAFIHLFLNVIFHFSLFQEQLCKNWPWETSF